MNLDHANISTRPFRSSRSTRSTRGEKTSRRGALAYDSSDGQFVLFGGGLAAGVLGDTWHLSMTSPCPADIATGGNCGDGAVNINDLLEVINSWGSCPAPCPPVGPCTADIDDDCSVNINDLLAVINAWGACP